MGYMQLERKMFRFSKYSIYFASFFLALFMALSSCSLAESTSWMGVYLMGSKVGNTKVRLEPAVYQGVKARKVVSVSDITIHLMGVNATQKTNSLSYTDLNDTPLYQQFVIESNGSKVQLTAVFHKTTITCEMNSGHGVTVKTLNIPEGAKFATDGDNPLQKNQYTVGAKYTLYAIDPLTISLDPYNIQIMSESVVSLNGKTYNAYRVHSQGPMEELSTWETADGTTLEADSPVGLTMYLESAKDALTPGASAPQFSVKDATTETKTGYVPPKDFALATSIASDLKIPDPRTATYLKLVVSGLSGLSIPQSDTRQQALKQSDGSYLIEIHATEFDSSKSVNLPISETQFQPYLRSAAYLEVNSPKVRELAAQLKGGDSNAYEVAERIRSWVYSHMTPNASIGVPRSCLDILDHPVGVCRDYATLYAGIARAAGIPTRLVSGIVYANGRFFYHAWAESWVGKWVPMDATLPNSFVDATHVKLAQGEVTDMYGVSGMIGRIKVKVLEAD